MNKEQREEQRDRNRKIVRIVWAIAFLISTIVLFAIEGDSIFSDVQNINASDYSSRGFSSAGIVFSIISFLSLFGLVSSFFTNNVKDWWREWKEHKNDKDTPKK